MRNISLEKDTEILERFKKLDIRLSDIQEDFIRSSGPGGQNVNKVATCVVLHHIPTGLKVKCQQERTQALNRLKARLLLVEKIEQLLESQKALKKSQREKLRRKNRKPSKKSKEVVLEQKARQSDKKTKRRKIQMDKWKD